MVTLFSIPKPFTGQISAIQRNALANWRRLGSEVEIVLLGNDEGVDDAAREFGVRHEPDIAVNAYGTPTIGDAFSRVRSFSKQPILMYSNADMLYDDSLTASLMSTRRLPAFLMSGQRWDLDVENDLRSLNEAEWKALFDSRRSQGRLHGPAGMDFFAFPRQMVLELPDFAVGRAGWDSWVVWHCRMRRLPVINATQSIVAIHQNHDYRSLRLGYQHWRGPERDLNIRAAGGLSHLLTLREASHELVGGALRRATGWRAISAALAIYRPYRWGLAAKRWLQRKLN